MKTHILIHRVFRPVSGLYYVWYWIFIFSYITLESKVTTVLFLVMLPFIFQVRNDKEQIQSINISAYASIFPNSRNAAVAAHTVMHFIQLIWLMIPGVLLLLIFPQQWLKLLLLGITILNVRFVLDWYEVVISKHPQPTNVKRLLPIPVALLTSIPFVFNDLTLNLVLMQGGITLILGSAGLIARWVRFDSIDQI